MPCFHPLTGALYTFADGSRKLSFTNLPPPYSSREIVQVPCGQCIGCRLEKSRKWAMRCVMEASLHDSNCFVTLTYDDDHLPKDGDQWKKDYVDFMKRLRKRLGKVRFFHCGEYGERNGRPHHHAILFGIDFTDRERSSSYSQDSGFFRYFSSPILSSLWPFGYSSVGDMTFESAAYVARYCLKKVTGPAAEAHYKGWPPEYVTMSRRPGIAQGWLDKYMSDVYPADRCFARGVPCKPPRYFDEQFKLYFPAEFDKLKAMRRKLAARLADDNTAGRLQVKEELVVRRMASVSRSL